MTARVTMYTRSGCHLCDDALDVVSQVCAAQAADFQLVDVDGDPELRDRYGEQVPVVTVDGVTVGFWRIDAEVLRQALA